MVQRRPVSPLKKYPNTTWSGTVSYENASGERKRKPFSITAEHERLALVHNEEAPKTQFELQKIPDRLEAIAGELARIRRLLEGKKTELTNPKEIEAVLRAMAEATKDGA